MPRRNFVALVIISAFCATCYLKAREAHRSEQSAMFDAFIEVLGHIERQYLEDVDRRDLFEGAVSGMVARLDEYSAYIPPPQATAFRENLEHRFGGIGVEIGVDDETGQLTVMSALLDTPAYKVGMRAGDRIEGIDGTSTRGFKLTDAVERLRGDPGEPVTLSLLRYGATEPVEVRIVRDLIHIDTVLGDTRNKDGSWKFRLEDHPDIAYVRVTSFGDTTASELISALGGERASSRGMILDLRSNPGGLLEAAVETCDLFLASGRIVSTRGRDRRERQVFDATSETSFPRIPMVILVNSFSASAAEIVAACLQDHGRAVVVGERTWGKGTVQNVIEIEGRTSVLKLTTASYWRPSGKNIHRTSDAKAADTWGVRPNKGYEVSLSQAEFVLWDEQRRVRDLPRGPDDTSLPAPFVDQHVNKAIDYFDSLGASSKRGRTTAAADRDKGDS